jgi:quercetin dioxygenase-like cupin family protein
MFQTSRRIVLALTLWTVPLGAAQAADAAKRSDGITRKVVEKHPIAGTTKVLELLLVEFPPGAQSPAHTHPAVGLNYVLSGEVASQYENEPVKHYKAGDTYQDAAGKKHLLFKNTSRTESLKLLIAVELEDGQSFLQVLSPQPQ